MKLLTTEQINKLALQMEGIWSNVFYKKDHASLSGALMSLMSDVDYKRALDEVKDYANNYDNAPTVATLSRLCHRDPEKTVSKAKRDPERVKYVEDSDGYGYYFPDSCSCDCLCIWRPDMRGKGISKAKILKEHGIFADND